MRTHITTCFVLLVTTSGVAGAVVTVATVKQPPDNLRYVNAKQASVDALVVDTRTLSVCQKRSIASAHCLPANDLLGPDGKLASFADIFWALGTAGISGHETILVTEIGRAHV